jgi:hypothetical protein
MAKAQAEFDNAVGKSQRVEDADIPNLKYKFTSCHQESLTTSSCYFIIDSSHEQKSMQCVQVCLTCGDHDFGECWCPSLRPKIVGGSIGNKT